ncbi:MAG: hypothetical protein A4S09_07790 [Proteobacteria bacterium SG_bin7]|nr:MAG: hypothetical protein A4S09_07790 [Proteobacteria bacterium SG_bin7]
MTVAWNDPGQILSLRKIDGRDHQFYIRLFSDGKIRTHHELLTEAHPLGHIVGADFTPNKDYFLPLLNKFIERGANKK